MPENERIMSSFPATYYHDLLVDIYPCKVPFTVVVKEDKPKRRLGTYYGSTRRIVLHMGWAHKYDPVEVAIHEYAHHLHDTEFKSEKKQAPHGPEFWQIYGQLMGMAKAKGIIDKGPGPILGFPNPVVPQTVHERMDEERLPPKLEEVMRGIFRSAYDWLNRD